MREVAQLPTPTIATRTEPIGRSFPRSLLAESLLVVGRGAGWSGDGWVGGVPVAALGVDEVRQPADLPLHRLDAVALELRGVRVDLLLGQRELVLDAVQTLLEAGAAPFEHAQPDLHVGATEEREPDVEVVVLPRGRTHLRHEALELTVTGLGDLVDDPRPPGDRGDRGRGLLDQRATQHLLQGGVERAVRQHAAPAEHEVEPLAQLVAVHGSLVQQPEDCQLDGLCTTCHATYRTDISSRGEPPAGTACHLGDAYPVEVAPAERARPTCVERAPEPPESRS